MHKFFYMQIKANTFLIDLIIKFMLSVKCVLSGVFFLSHTVFRAFYHFCNNIKRAEPNRSDRIAFGI